MDFGVSSATNESSLPGGHHYWYQRFGIQGALNFNLLPSNIKGANDVGASVLIAFGASNVNGNASYYEQEEYYAGLDSTSFQTRQLVFSDNFNYWVLTGSLNLRTAYQIAEHWYFVGKVGLCYSTSPASTQSYSYTFNSKTTMIKVDFAFPSVFALNVYAGIAYAL